MPLAHAVTVSDCSVAWRLLQDDVTQVTSLSGLSVSEVAIYVPIASYLSISDELALRRESKSFSPATARRWRGCLAGSLEIDSKGTVLGKRVFEPPLRATVGATAMGGVWMLDKKALARLDESQGAKGGAKGAKGTKGAEGAEGANAASAVDHVQVQAVHVAKASRKASSAEPTVKKKPTKQTKLNFQAQ